MAARKPKSNLLVLDSCIYPGRHHVTLGEHIIGVLLDDPDGVRIARLKVDRDEDGLGVYVSPGDDLSAPYPVINEAAKAVYRHWLAAA